MTDFPEMMTVKETANFLRCSPRHIYEQLRQGRIPGIKNGKEWRVSKTALIEFTRENVKQGR